MGIGRPHGSAMWNSLHVTYYSATKDELLLDGIRPAIQDVLEPLRTRRVYLRRHWRFGPHIAVNYDVPSGEAAECGRLLTERIGRFLRRVPSTVCLDEERYATDSHKWGQAELMPPPYLPLRPDNEVQPEAYSVREQLLGGTVMAAEMEAYLSDTTPLVFDTLDQSRGKLGHRFGVLALVFGATASVYPGRGARYGHLSFRSHAEAYLASVDETERRRLRIARDRNLPSLRRGLEAILKGSPASSRTHECVLRWRDMHEERVARFERLAKEGIIPDHFALAQSFAERTGGFAFFANGTPKHRSDFHSLGTDISREMRAEPAFDAYRLLLNLFYMTLPLMGLDAHAKYTLCYLVAEATEEVLGETWRSILGR